MAEIKSSIPIPDDVAATAEVLEGMMKTQFARLLYADSDPKVERRTPAQIDREPGFYWVNNTFGDGWEVERWTGKEWVITGAEEGFDHDPPHIGPRLQEPSE